MKGWLRFRNKPIIRVAYCITGLEHIERINATKSCITIEGVDYLFTHTTNPQAGDFIAYVSAADIYLVPRKNWLDREYECIEGEQYELAL